MSPMVLFGVLGVIIAILFMILQELTKIRYILTPKNGRKTPWERS